MHYKPLAPHLEAAEPTQGRPPSLWLTVRLTTDPLFARATLIAWTAAARIRTPRLGRFLSSTVADDRQVHHRDIPTGSESVQATTLLAKLQWVANGQRLFVGPRADDSVSMPEPSDGIPKGLISASQILLAGWEWELADTDDAIYRDLILPALTGLDAWYTANASPWVDGLIVTTTIFDNLRSRTVHHLRARMRQDAD